MENKGSQSSLQHKKMASEKGPVGVAIITVSDTRSYENDQNGQYLKAQLENSGHIVHSYRIIQDDPGLVKDTINGMDNDKIQIILMNGGTGISKRDTTHDVISKLYEKELPGFGELFRMLSYHQVGSAAMFSRASAGLYRGKIILSTPGSHAAVVLAWEKLISPELQHLAWEIQR